jgi:hypothetical protein
MALQIKYLKKKMNFALIVVTGCHSSDDIVGMFGMPRINCRNVPKSADGKLPYFWSSRHHPDTSYKSDLCGLS